MTRPNWWLSWDKGPSRISGIFVNVSALWKLDSLARSTAVSFEPISMAYLYRMRTFLRFEKLLLSQTWSRASWLAQSRTLFLMTLMTASSFLARDASVLATSVAWTRPTIFVVQLRIRRRFLWFYLTLFPSIRVPSPRCRRLRSEGPWNLQRQLEDSPSTHWESEWAGHHRLTFLHQ